jgi:hypothetical protein
MRKITIGLSALLAVSPAFAVTMQSSSGGSGLGLMRTAEVMDAGEFALSLGGTMSSYRAKGLLPDTVDTFTVPSLSYGIGGWSEVHLTVPYITASPSGFTNADGMADPQLIVKFGRAKQDDIGFSTAVTLFGSLSRGDKNAGVVSGDTQYGLELNLSNRFNNGAVHFNLGYEKTDAPVRITNPVRVEKYTAAFGAETALSSSTNLFVESTGYHTVDTNDNNLILTAGLQFTPTPSLGIQLGYGQGFPRSRSEPESVVLANLTYSPNARPKQRYSAVGNMEEYRALEGQTAELSSRVTDLDLKVNSVETRLAAVETKPVPMATTTPMASPAPMISAAPVSTGPRVEVVNASSNPAVVQRVMAQLQRAGAQVVNSRKQARTERTTSILYRDGFSHEAINLGHKIDGSQIVAKRKLAEGVDIQVLIGNRIGTR